MGVSQVRHLLKYRCTATSGAARSWTSSPPTTTARCVRASQVRHLRMGRGMLDAVWSCSSGRSRLRSVAQELCCFWTSSDPERLWPMGARCTMRAAGRSALPHGAVEVAGVAGSGAHFLLELVGTCGRADQGGAAGGSAAARGPLLVFHGPGAAPHGHRVLAHRQPGGRLAPSPVLPGRVPALSLSQHKTQLWRVSAQVFRVQAKP